MLEIISQEVESESLRKFANKCTELKIRLHNVVHTKEEIIKERLELEQQKEKHIKDRSDRKNIRASEYKKLVETERKLHEINEKLAARNRELLKNKTNISSELNKNVKKKKDKKI